MHEGFSHVAAKGILVAVLVGAAASAAIAAEPPSRFAVLVEGGTAWEGHGPQSFLLADPIGREPQLDFDRGVAWGVGVDVQLAPLFVLRASYEVAEPDLSMTLFPPPGIGNDQRVAAVHYRAIRAGIYFHGLLRRDLFDPGAETRTMGRFGVSVARAGLRDPEISPDVSDAFGVVATSHVDEWTFALEAEWIARLGSSRWFAGAGLSFGIGPGPKIILEPGPGSEFVRSEFEYRQNRLVARLGYRF